MVASQFSLTPALKRGVATKKRRSVNKHLSSVREEAVFLISLRLRELNMLVPVKSESIFLIRSRIAANGSTSALLRDLREQQEQLKDLVQLAEDWRNLANHVSSLSPSLSELSTPLKNKLSILGVEAKSIAN